MERSLVAHLTETGRTEEANRLRNQQLDGLVGWGVLVHDAQQAGKPLPLPNPTRWGHLRLS